MKVVLFGNPLSTQTIYRYTCMGKIPRLYMTKEGKELKKYYQLEIRNQYQGEIITDDIEMIITLFFKDGRRRDIDNYNKLVLDALEGIVYQNDSQIQTLGIKKDISADNPRIEIQWQIL